MPRLTDAEHAVPPAQLAAWRRTWELLLAPIRLDPEPVPADDDEPPDERGGEAA
jgi:hypothetical protein